ncbi:unnamed protein product [Dictyota dichotoma]|uniref:Ribosomal protein L31 n=1 Tax=Dictyota dichotoma TaxID=2876 RepID=Q2TUA6_DICDH|nr:ribosomal protein L31 [Dictyota dichotoma]AAS79089.1 ribosomal protein L31 [Dictyota dichotoma]
MKSVFSCFILSNGGLLVTEKPCFKSVLVHNILVKDSVNHPLWSSLFGEPQTEVSKFIGRFNIKNRK